MNADLTKLRNDLQVRAVDGDAPGSKNSDVRYEILTGNYERKFAIDSVTGVISVKEPLLDEEGIERRRRRRRGRNGKQQSRDAAGGAHTQSCLLIKCKCELSSSLDNVADSGGAVEPVITLTVRAYDLGIPSL